MIDRRAVMRKLYWIIVTTAVLIIPFHLGKAYGSERHEHHDHGDTVNIYNTFNKNDRFWEGAAKGAGAIVITVCGIWPATESFVWPATVGLFTGSKPKWKPWVNCWESSKDEPLPNPGQALKVTPDNTEKVRLYQ